LPYPVVNLVFDRELTAVFGVVSGSYEHRLTGANRCLGLRFRPGAFRGLLGRPLHTITDVHLPLSAVLPVDDTQAEHAVLSQPDDAGMVAAAEALLRPLLGPPDPKVERLNALLAQVQDDATLTRVDELAERAGLGMRALQAWFSDYVGVSPKWVIRRYRLHEAADQLARGQALDLAELAQRLGYYDQSHLTRDFSRLVGKPPQAYRSPPR
jgi:AraC-like DNA-binding protein